MSPIEVSAAAASPALRADLGGGLLEAQALKVGTGFLQAEGGYSFLYGPYARGELGYHPLDGFSIYGVGSWNRVEPYAGVGLRWDF